MKALHACLWALYILTAAAILTTSNSFQSNLAADALGIILLVGGGWFMVWAKYWLGRQYERLPKIKEGHVLIMNGPYAMLRHPEYFGMAAAFLGLSLVLKSYVGLVVWLAALVPIHAYLAFKEERLLEKHFKQQHKEYKQRVGLLPKIKGKGA